MEKPHTGFELILADVVVLELGLEGQPRARDGRDNIVDPPFGPDPGAGNLSGQVLVIEVEAAGGNAQFVVKRCAEILAG